MVSGLTIGLPVQTIVTHAQQKQVDLRRFFPADEVAAMTQAAQAASALERRWNEDTAAICDEMALKDLKNAYTAAIAYFIDHPTGRATTALLTQNGYKPTEGVRLEIIDGVIKSLKMRTAHKWGGSGYEIDALGNITKKNKDAILGRGERPAAR